MAEAELRSTFQAHEIATRTLTATPRLLDLDVDAFADEVAPAVQRLGLTHQVSSFLFEGSPGAWSEGAHDCCLPLQRSIAVRYTRVEETAPWKGPEVEAKVGGLLAPGRRVDLRNPDIVIDAFLLRDRIVVAQRLWTSDPKALAARHVDQRPHSTPVSIEPRLGRALVNLGGLVRGQTLWDPFCGTGGLLLEAAEMGLRVIGSDLDPQMVEGTRRNLDHFGFHGEVRQGDVEAVAAELRAEGRLPVDAVVSDLPYGRSSTLGGEEVASLVRRGLQATADALRPGGHAVIGVAEAQLVEDQEPRLRVQGRFAIRSHKSLTRYFLKLERI